MKSLNFAFLAKIPTYFTFFSKLSTPKQVLCILASAFIIAFLFIVTAPSSKRVRPPVSSPVVVTIISQKNDAPLTVNALGTVKAAQQTIVRARVSGQVKALGTNFEPGGIIKKDELILQLDDDDYKNALALKKSTYAEAKAAYQLEMGQQRVARTELEQLEKIMPDAAKRTALALRTPQLAQAKAVLEAAEADMNQAKLNLERTKIIAPYNALVLKRDVSLGSQASNSDMLATIAGIDEYHIEASIPLDKLQALGISVFDDAKVNVYTATNNMREGSVLHSIASLDETTRMGRVLVSVHDPLGLKSGQAHLLLGDQVRVELQAGLLKNAVTLPRIALRGNDTVWVAMPKVEEKPQNLEKKPQNSEQETEQKTEQKNKKNPSYTLDIRSVTVAWKSTEYVIITEGLESDEHIITSPLGAPIQNMPVRISVPKNNRQNKTPIAKQNPEGK